MIVANDITELIGRTPMVKISRLTGPNDATVYAKLEWYNIGGSVKDRMALYLMEYAAASGRLSRDKVILEATSGNTGIALAMLAAAKGYRITIVMPESVSIERRRIIRAYGAELILSPGEKGTGGAIELKERLLRENPEKYVDLDQFKDPANILAHYQTTGREILEQTRGIVDMVVVGIGTAGTGVGVSMRLKEFNSKIKVIGVTTKLGVIIQGLRNPKETYPTMLFRREFFDEVVEIDEEGREKAFQVVREAARREGLLIGMSSGAIMMIALQKAREIGRDKTIVAILPDSGEKYLSTGLFD
ncbi:MAG: PLP-dependent cysteine synthase family protein [Crenarchaeota archaeon]|nr:PLP-dependent cysteine synthase family protein [Thermoproteota archaeon]MDW8033483.1 PLP-dependent cysteine synthase family protein [Nitrososphaerota archaeon]